MPEFMLDDQNIPPPLDYETPPPPPPDDDPDHPIRSKVYSRHYSVGSNDPD